jgi:hypothetical protein
MVTIGVTLSQSKQAIDIAEKNEHVWACIGIHPNHAGEEGPVPEPETIAALANHPKVIGIGESGLDYFYDKAPRDVQEQNFPREYPRRPNLRPAACHPRPRCGFGYRPNAGGGTGEGGRFRLPAALFFLRPRNWPRPRSKWAAISPSPAF